MIKSLTFTGEFGYINEKIKEPMCPVRGYNGEKTSSWFYRDLSKKEKEMFEKWKKEHAEWEKHKDDYSNPHLVKKCLGLFFADFIFCNNNIYTFFTDNFKCCIR